MLLCAEQRLYNYCCYIKKPYLLKPQNKGSAGKRYEFHTCTVFLLFFLQCFYTDIYVTRNKTNISKKLTIMYKIVLTAEVCAPVLWYLS